MKRDKSKAIFAIGGIMVSIILLTAIGMVNDTLSYNYMGLVTNTTGSADIMITRNIKSDITFDPFFGETLITNNLQNIDVRKEGLNTFINLPHPSEKKIAAFLTKKSGAIDTITENDFVKYR
ncbi:MAG: hypothetical protein ACFFKA_16040, partial [Candidatus Thorarchaeota archaeon]